MDVRIVPLAVEDIDIMCERIQDIDRLEFSLMSDGKPLVECFEHLLDRSRRARAAYADGRLVAVYGVISPTVLSSEGYPWLAVTDAVQDRAIRRELVRNTRREAAWMAEGFSKLWNLVHEDNRVAIRWIKWLGFDFDGTEYLVRGHKFLKFQMEE